MRATRTRWIILTALLLALSGSRAATPLVPAGDDEVVEHLPAATIRQTARTPAAAVPVARAAGAVLPDASGVAGQARSAIALARQTGDTRYWGRAQALLAPWWDRSDAPPDLAVLQATVLQGRHAFDAARQVLAATLIRWPGHAQGWLTLASLERLQGRYDATLRACEAVAGAGQPLYATACRLETRSLQGHQGEAEAGLRQLVAQNANSGGTGAWLLSLLAESLERSGQEPQAERAYRRSLALEHDLYTATALADLLLRQGRPEQAVPVLAQLPQTDAVLLRQASAWRAIGDGRWQDLRAQLQERSRELRRRGDDPALHGRELALAALWLDDDPRRALELALRNLDLQREPLDWWVALRSARLAGDERAARRIRQLMQQVGLHDRRLADLAGPAPTVVGARP